MTKKPESLSEIDESLMKDTTGDYKRNLLSQLLHYKQVVKNKMDLGELNPSEFEVASKYLKSIEAAENIIRDR